MKYILPFLLLSSSLHAATIDCYSGSKKIYHGVSDSFASNKDVLIVSYKKYDDIIFLNKKNPPHCIARNVKG